VLVLTGDLSTGSRLAADLEAIAVATGEPRNRRPLDIYFVLGNHDLWDGWTKRAVETARGAAAGHARLHYLPDLETGVPLGEKTLLVGTDGWYDMRAGRGTETDQQLNDRVQIEDLRCLGDREVNAWHRERAHVETRKAQALVRAGLVSGKDIVLATHVPPCDEAALYMGKKGGGRCQPLFVCQELGEALLALAAEYPAQRITVLSGHTHSGARVLMWENLEVLVGEATYGYPALQPVLWCR
jgi:hypothetical protein